MSTQKKVLFLCGSPRGKRSASRITAEYLSQFLDYDYEFVDVGRARLSSDPNEAEQAFVEVAGKMKAADAIIWVFGAWLWFMPLDLQYLLDKLFTQSGYDFSDKIAASVMTSVRVRDDYILEKARYVSEQLGMHYIGDVSADGNPFTGYEGDENTTEHSCRILAGQINRALSDPFVPLRKFEPVERKYLSSTWSGDRFDTSWSETAKTGDKTITVVTGLSIDDHPSVASVIESIRRSTRNRIRVIELASHKVGRCIGCYECDFRVEGKCIVKDEYESLKERLIQSDGVVFVGVAACSVVDSKLKALLDRSWGVAHRPPLDKRYGICVSVGGGPLSAETTTYLQDLLSMMGVTVVGGIGVRGDEPNPGEAIRRMVEDIDRAMDEQWQIAKRFLIRAIDADFRDLAATAGMALKADFKYRKDNKLFNAPSPGGMNVIWRWIFSFDKLSKKLIEANKSRVNQVRAKRLSDYRGAGGQLGSGKAVVIPTRETADVA